MAVNPGQDAYNAGRLALIAEAVAVVAPGVISELVGGDPLQLRKIPGWLEQRILEVLGPAEELVGAPLFESVVAAAAGIEGLGAPGSQEEQAVRMVKRMLGFAVALPFATSELRDGLKLALGNHAPEGILKAIEEIPLDLGVNFFIGTVLERIFEVAVARPLEEAIASRTRPARLDYREIRALLRAHVLSEPQARHLLALAGYPEELIDLLYQLDRTLLSVGDVQAAYLNGDLDQAAALERFDQLGYSPEDAGVLLDTYLKRAQTEGAQVLKDTARQGLLDGHLSEQQAAAIMASANVPAASIQLELASAQLRRSWGTQRLSVSQVKTLHAQGSIDDRQALGRLLTLGYSEDDAQQLIESWGLEKQAGHPGVTEQRVLSFYLGGTISRERALGLLLEIGVKPTDADLLLDHPGARGGVFAYPLNPATVTAAVQYGILGQDDALQLLDRLGVDPAEAQLEIQLAMAKVRRGPKPKQPHKTLSESQVLAAYDAGLATEPWAVAELVTIGYSEEDAQLLVAELFVKRTSSPPPGWVELA